MSEWQPIDTAPKGGGELSLMFEPHDEGGFIFVGAYDAIKRQFFNNLDFKTQNPTHWMPLPQPPENK